MKIPEKVKQHILDVENDLKRRKEEIDIELMLMYTEIRIKNEIYNKIQLNIRFFNLCALISQLICILFQNVFLICAFGFISVILSIVSIAINKNSIKYCENKLKKLEELEIKLNKIEL